jgi:Protein of unknown function (DUF3078)
LLEKPSNAIFFNQTINYIMKRIFLASAICFTVSGLFAQDGAVKDLQASAGKEVKSAEKDGTTKSGTFALNVNQGSLSNWAGGGEKSTLGINGIFLYQINNRKGKNTFDTYFDIALGMQNATSYNAFRKTDDRIDITSKYGYQMGSSKWYATLLANFNTQILKGYDYGATTNTKISNLFAPGKLLVSPGFDYKPNSKFSLFLSPITTRWVFKSDADFLNSNKFGVAVGKKVNNEIGAFATMKYTTPLSTWATYTGRCDLFSNYKRNPGNVDLFMTNLISLKVSKYLATNISFDVVYDDDVLKKTQIKEILGVGLTVKL